MKNKYHYMLNNEAFLLWYAKSFAKPCGDRTRVPLDECLNMAKTHFYNLSAEEKDKICWYYYSLLLYKHVDL